eukprot:357017-Chlamydomonas_euryale.AAC.2
MSTLTPGPTHRVAGAGQLLAQPHELRERLVDKVRECEQPQGVAGGRSVKHNACEARVLGALNKLHDLGDRDGLVKARRRRLEQLPELEVGQLVREHAEPYTAQEVLRLALCAWRVVGICARKQMGQYKGDGSWQRRASVRPPWRLPASLGSALVLEVDRAGGRMDGWVG